MKRYLPKLKELSVLVVEDDDMQRHLLVTYLNKLGISKISQADNGYMAINQVRQQPTDVILFNLSMPELDGLGLLRLLNDVDYQGTVTFLNSVDKPLLRSAENLATNLGLHCAGSLTSPYQLIELATCLINFFLKPEKTQKPLPIAQQLTKQMLLVALEKKQIYPVFQPQVDMKTGKVVAVEVLARWQHARLGNIPPEQFIALAEAHNLINEVTELISISALNLLDTLPEKYQQLAVSINVSPLSLNNNLIQHLILHLKQQYQRPVTIEITELSDFNDIHTAIEVLARLRMNGCAIALDDFGTGHSTLKSLTQFPLHEVKIDRDFIASMRRDMGAKVAVESTIELAKKLGLKVVAEGVSEKYHWQQLEQMGCDLAQGFLMSKPVPANELVATIKSWQQRYRRWQLAAAQQNKCVNLTEAVAL